MTERLADIVARIDGIADGETRARLVHILRAAAEG